MTTEEVAAFVGGFRSLMMASLTPEGEPHASTAPFVRIGDDFYLLISTVAQHGRNLLVASGVSLLFAEDEAVCSQPFARRRITIDAAVAPVPRNDPRFAETVAVFQSRFDPELVQTLSGMGDFHLFRLTPRSGSAVSGFGRAYRLNERLEVVTQMVGHHQRGGGGHG